MAEDPRPTEYETASIVQRVIAHVIDSAVAVLVMVITVRVLNLESVLGILLFALSMGVALAYRMFGDSYFDGHALGKRLVGIRVFDARRRKPCTHKQSLLRNCILFIPMMPLIELVFLSIDGQERWGDRLAQTYV
ncbi:MAG TPA: RDD family protein, partial [Candidatus Saccharimonadia bacterium]|nr:RDD family protein [Candidatus Saccharimonadia bacterium]